LTSETVFNPLLIKTCAITGDMEAVFERYRIYSGFVRFISQRLSIKDRDRLRVTRDELMTKLCRGRLSVFSTHDASLIACHYLLAKGLFFFQRSNIGLATNIDE
jgi:hypothetical protein